MMQATSALFAGTYSGAINGTPTTLILQQEGTALRGEADAGGYRYTLHGTATEQAAQGTLSDAQTGGTMPVELALQADVLTLTLIAEDPYTAFQQRVPLTFQRSGRASQDRQASTPEPTSETHEHDTTLVGQWTFTETMISGGFSAVTQLFLYINADGTFAYGNGRTMAGGESAWGSIHGDTGYGDDVTHGAWRTQQQVIYVKETGSPQSMPYARYYIEDGTLMMAFADSSRQLWYRQ